MKATMLVLCVVILAACQPSNPPPAPLPTKEQTIDRVNEKLNDAMKVSRERLDAVDPEKKGF